MYVPSIWHWLASESPQDLAWFGFCLPSPEGYLQLQGCLEGLKVQAPGLGCLFALLSSGLLGCSGSKVSSYK